MNKREGTYAAVVDNEILFYDNPTTTLLRALKINAHNLKKNIKIFKTVRSDCSGSVDGLIVNPNNAEPKYFTSYKEAEAYAKSTKEQYDLLPCKEIVL